MKNKIKNISLILVLAIFTVAVFACKNSYNNLIPKDGKEILEFSLMTTDGNSRSVGTRINGSYVSVSLPKGSPIHSLLAKAKISPQAKIIPLTEMYLKKIFPNSNPVNIAMQIATGKSAKELFFQLYAENPHFEIPEMNEPIDFSRSVDFLVISGVGEIKNYTVIVVEAGSSPILADPKETPLEACSVAKFKNPALVKDAKSYINSSNKEVTIEALYPVEYEGNFYLNIDLKHGGQSAQIEYKDTKYKLNSEIPFVPEDPSGTGNNLGKAEARILIRNTSGEITPYDLKIEFNEDPETIRSITDFRFEKFINKNIAMDTMASISNEGDYGTIEATVLYSTTTVPNELCPSFITPGTVSVNNVTQTSRNSKQNFETEQQYLCTSKNGIYKRMYTVKVKFIYTEPAKAVLKSFNFSKNLNPSLTEDAIGVIDENAKKINIEVKYAGGTPPYNLTAEFASIGDVSLSNITQSSGFTSNNFEYPLFYKVTSTTDSTVTEYYEIRVQFIASPDAQCRINDFRFETEKNSYLSENINATISQAQGEIYCVLPKGTDVSALIPTFNAQGRVTINSVEQTSGVSRVDFGQAITYTVTSLDGNSTKDYTVRIQWDSGIIFVNPKATGMNNGTSWENAFTTIDIAVKYIATLPIDSVAEVWLTDDGVYSSVTQVRGKFRWTIDRAFTLRGGFKGTESSIDERQNNASSCVNVRQFYSENPIAGIFKFDSITLPENNITNMLEEIKWDESKAETNELCIENSTLNYCRLNISDKKINKFTLKNSSINENSTLTLNADSITPCLEINIENSSFKCKTETSFVKRLNLINTSFADGCIDNINAVKYNFESIDCKSSMNINVNNVAGEGGLHIKNCKLGNITINCDSNNTYSSTLEIENSKFDTLDAGYKSADVISSSSARLVDVSCNKIRLYYKTIFLKNFKSAGNTDFDLSTKYIDGSDNIYCENCDFSNWGENTDFIEYKFSDSSTVNFKNCIFDVKTHLTFTDVKDLNITNSKVNNAPSNINEVDYYMYLKFKNSVPDSFLQNKEFNILILDTLEKFELKTCFINAKLEINSKENTDIMYMIDKCSFGNNCEILIYDNSYNKESNTFLGKIIIQNCEFNNNCICISNIFRVFSPPLSSSARMFKKCSFEECEFIGYHFDYNTHRNTSFIAVSCTFTETTLTDVLEINTCEFTDCSYVIVSKSANNCVFNNCRKIIAATNFFYVKQNSAALNNCVFNNCRLLYLGVCNDSKLTDCEDIHLKNLNRSEVKFTSDFSRFYRFDAKDVKNCTFDASEVSELSGECTIKRIENCKFIKIFAYFDVYGKIFNSTFNNTGTVKLIRGEPCEVRNSTFKSDGSNLLLEFKVSDRRADTWVLKDGTVTNIANFCVLDNCSFTSPATDKIRLSNVKLDTEDQTHIEFYKNSAIVITGNNWKPICDSIKLENDLTGCVATGKLVFNPNEGKYGMWWLRDFIVRKGTFY